MKDKLSFMIMEGPGDEIQVQLYEDGPKALDAFHNLAGKPGDAPTRATFLLIDFDKDAVVHFEKKELPDVPDPDAEPWGHRLGAGPLGEPPPKESEEGGGNSG